MDSCTKESTGRDREMSDFYADLERVMKLDRRATAGKYVHIFKSDYITTSKFLTGAQDTHG